MIRKTAILKTKLLELQEHTTQGDSIKLFTQYTTFSPKFNFKLKELHVFESFYFI